MPNWLGQQTKVEEVTYYQISTTAPTNERLSKEMAVYSILESLNIPYERIDHPEAMTIEACQDIDKIFNLEMNKNLFLCNPYFHFC